jgi:tetratricopeptide (TPR) repeat protein
MPFKKTTSKLPRVPLIANTTFIGRTEELYFFVENILKPEEPDYNIVSVSGQGGVGKSTLLKRFIDEIQNTYFREYCAAAIVDERHTNPAIIMEKIAEQLHIRGEFEKAVNEYKGVFRRLRDEQLRSREAVLGETVPSMIGSIFQDIVPVPGVNVIVREGAKASTKYLLNEHHYRQSVKMAERLEDPIGDLTKAFVKELNYLTDIQVIHMNNRTKHQRRVVLFVDTFEQLATETAPWLLNHFLQASINPNVVLVIAGRDPIEHSTSDDFIHWLPYYDDQTIYSITLNSFSQDETRHYLDKRGITEQNRIDVFWQLSRGLPLYLSLLTSNQNGEVDPTTNVVANFLRWIPEQEHIKRHLVLEAAFFPKPFNQDDLMAFTYISEQERPILYNWLTVQPFVRSSPQDGRYTYHELAQEMFIRHLHQRSPQEYHSTLRALATHYKLLLEKTEEEMGQEVYASVEWLELTSALVRLLLLLPDEASHIRAIELVLNEYEHREQTGEIARALRELSQKQPLANLLLQYIELNFASQEQNILVAAQGLLEKLIDKPTFSAVLLASIYCKRGLAYFSIREFQQAIKDFDSAIELNSRLAWVYCFRGLAHRNLDEYQQAIQDFDRALTLEPKLGSFYNDWGLAYFSLTNYHKAIEDLDHRAKLDPNYVWVYINRGIAYRNLWEYQRAIEDFDYALRLNPHYAQAYIERGITYRYLQKYEQAIKDFNLALTQNTKDASAYASRGETYRLLKEYQRAIEDFDQAVLLDPKYVWAYARRGQTYTTLNQYEQAFEDFDRAISLDPYYDFAYANRGYAFNLLKDFKQAIQDFDYALKLNTKYAWAYSKRGWTYLLLKNLKNARDDIIQSWQLDPTNLTNGWLIEWIGMCIQRVDSEITERLEALSDLNPQHYVAYICQSVALWIHKNFDQALAELGQAIPIDTESWNIEFWKGVFCAYVGRDEEAISSIQKALLDNLPPILLTPLRWIEEDRPDFYGNYVVPLLARYEIQIS